MFLLIHIPFYSLSYCRIIFIIEAKFKVNNFKNTAIMFVPFRYWFWCRILDVSKVCMWNKVSEIWVIEQNLITYNGAPSLSQLSFTDISSSFKCDQMGDSWYQTKSSSRQVGNFGQRCKNTSIYLQVQTFTNTNWIELS